MKKFVAFAFCIWSLSSMAQFGASPTIHSSLPFLNTPQIKVIGTAVKEVTPDKVYFRITLTEDRTGRKKTRIDSLEQRLYRLMDDFKIPRKNLSIVQNSQKLIDKKRSDAEIQISRQYSLLVNDKVDLRSLLLAFAENEFHQIHISHIDHSKKAEFMQEVRKQAMKDASQKAKDLLAAIGQETGALLWVVDHGSNPLRFTNLSQVNRSYNSFIASPKFYRKDFNFEKLKLRASYQLVYEIKKQ